MNNFEIMHSMFLSIENKIICKVVQIERVYKQNVTAIEQQIHDRYAIKFCDEADKLVKTLKTSLENNVKTINDVFENECVSIILGLFINSRSIRRKINQRLDFRPIMFKKSDLIFPSNLNQLLLSKFERKFSDKFYFSNLLNFNKLVLFNNVVYFDLNGYSNYNIVNLYSLNNNSFLILLQSHANIQDIILFSRSKLGDFSIKLELDILTSKYRFCTPTFTDRIVLCYNKNKTSIIKMFDYELNMLFSKKSWIKCDDFVVSDNYLALKNKNFIQFYDYFIQLRYPISVDNIYNKFELIHVNKKYMYLRKKINIYDENFYSNNNIYSEHFVILNILNKRLINEHYFNFKINNINSKSLSYNFDACSRIYVFNNEDKLNIFDNAGCFLYSFQSKSITLSYELLACIHEWLVPIEDENQKAIISIDINNILN